MAFTKIAIPGGWMGNMSRHPVQYKGKSFATTEALFHSLRFWAYPEVVEAIRAQRNPMAAKQVAHSHFDLLTKEELAHDEEHMRTCLRVKVAQHPDLLEALLGTEDKVLIEDVTKRPKGKRWGAALEALAS
jgi:predicted NAD-dependent protein-ADP-ribosyltransferase YbiA (DUF1768 family)